MKGRRQPLREWSASALCVQLACRGMRTFGAVRESRELLLQHFHLVGKTGAESLELLEVCELCLLLVYAGEQHGRCAGRGRAHGLVSQVGRERARERLALVLHGGAKCGGWGAQREARVRRAGHGCSGAARGASWGGWRGAGGLGGRRAGGRAVVRGGRGRGRASQRSRFVYTRTFSSSTSTSDIIPIRHRAPRPRPIRPRRPSSLVHRYSLYLIQRPWRDSTRPRRLRNPSISVCLPLD